MPKEMRQEEGDIRMVEARKGTEMTFDMKALLTLAERHREEIRKESEEEQD
jgi:pantothenate kinase